MYLDDLKPIKAVSGYQNIGYSGVTGYDNEWINVKDQYYTRSFSAHPPSELVFDLNGEWESLIMEVGINSTCLDDRFSEFFVYADDLLVAHIPQLIKGDGKRNIACNLRGAKILTLKTTGNAHSIWIDPKLSKEKINKFQGCFSHLWANTTPKNTSKPISIMTTITPNFLKLFKSMLDSLSEVSNLNDLQFIALSFDSTPEVEKFCLDNNVIEIKCEDKKNKTAIGKKLISHSIPHVCDSEYFLFLDCDMLFKEDVVGQLLEALKVLDDSVFITTKELGMTPYIRLYESASWIYDSNLEELIDLGLTEDECKSKIVINTGVYGGSRQAFYAIEDILLRMFPKAEIWESHKFNSIREQILTNIATIRLKNTAFIKNSYNYQLHSHLDKIKSIDDVNKLPAKILHFNGNSRALLDGFIAKSKVGFNVDMDPNMFINTTGRTFANDLSPNANAINTFNSILQGNGIKSVLEVTPGNGIFCLHAALQGKKVYSVINGMNKDLQDLYEHAPFKISQNIKPIYQDHLMLAKLISLHKPYMENDIEYQVQNSDLILLDTLAVSTNPLFLQTAGTQLDNLLKILIPTLQPKQLMVIYGTEDLLYSIQKNIQETYHFNIIPVDVSTKPTFGICKIKNV